MGDFVRFMLYRAIVDRFARVWVVWEAFHGVLSVHLGPLFVKWWVDPLKSKESEREVGLIEQATASVLSPLRKH